jgi:hypothetical protein
MLYVASSIELPQTDTPELSIQRIDPRKKAVRQWLSLPFVHLAGAHTGCSCGFPSVVAEEPVEYDDGLFADKAEEERSLDLASVRALLDLIARCLAESGPLELYPVWNGNELDPPKGEVDCRLAELNPERFLFTEQFLYRITS